MLQRYCYLLICFFSFCTTSFLNGKILDEKGKHNYSNRTGKFLLFPGFKFITINQDPCSVDGQHGTCYAQVTCNRRGGTKIGTCGPGGVGTCCKFEFGCSNTTSYLTINETEVTIKDTRSCNYEFPKRDEFCQLEMKIVQVYGDPVNTGLCDGNLIIRGSTTVTDFPFCGRANHSFYLAYGEYNRLITLQFLNGEINNNYEVRVRYLRCDVANRVPDHCLQYYEGAKGQIQNFGYYSQGYILDQEYTICINNQRNKIQWSKCNPRYSDPYVPERTDDFYTSRHLYDFAAFGDSCEGASFIAVSGMRYCGTRFPEVVTSSLKPFTLTTKWTKDDFNKLPETIYMLAMSPVEADRCVIPSNGPTGRASYMAAMAGSPSNGINPICLGVKDIPYTQPMFNGIPPSFGYCLEYSQVNE